MLLAASLGLVGCTSLERPTVQADALPLPTPLRSFGASLAAAAAAVEAAVSALGERLETPPGAYRPSEPDSLLQTPRIIRRADLADIDDGYVVIYQADGRAAAGQGAEELARYLESGFGQTNFAADTQFSVSTLEDTIIFTSWSSRRSDDPARAEAVFEAMASVGVPVEVSK